MRPHIRRSLSPAPVGGAAARYSHKGEVNIFYGLRCGSACATVIWTEHCYVQRKRSFAGIHFGPGHYSK